MSNLTNLSNISDLNSSGLKKTYFMGYSTPDGFITHLRDDIGSNDFFTYIIKGGPGTGKSSLMKKVAERLSEYDTPEIYYCSSDPNSLDAVLFDKLKVIIADGTAPHVIEPVYPGARETLVDLGECWDSASLFGDKEGVIDASNRNQKYHSLAKRYLRAIMSVNEDILSIGDSVLCESKLESYCDRLYAKLSPKKKGISAKGKIKFRQMSSITPRGVLTFDNLFEGMKVYRIDDGSYAATDKILKRLAQNAADGGYDVLVSKNVFFAESVYQHIVIPEMSIAFVSGISYSSDDTAKINALRFYDREILRSKRRRLMFDSSIVKELTKEMASALKTAKDIHDELESYYIKAMDFDKVNEYCERLIDCIKLKAGI